MTETDWLTSSYPAGMLRFLYGARGPGWEPYESVRPNRRKLRLYLCACAKLMGKEVDVAERDADSLGEAGELHAGWRETPPESVEAFAHWDDVRLAATMVADCADPRYTGFPTGAQQAGILRDLIGNPFRPASLLPSWATSIGLNPIFTWHEGAIRRLAERIYQERAWDLLGVLHDALLDAGCDDEAILLHCRSLAPCKACTGTGRLDADHREGTIECRACEPWGSGTYPITHHRGCHVIDLLRGCA